MSGFFSSHTFSHLADDLDRAVAWVRLFGIEPNPTRLGNYVRAANLLKSAYNNARMDVLASDLPVFNNMFYEVLEFVAIHKALAGKYDEHLSEHVRKMVSGPVVNTDEVPETSSNVARDTTFELALMALVAQAGLQLNFKPKVDVALDFEGRHYLIECKRPRGYKGLEKNLKDAKKQLTRACGAALHTRTRGIVALDITRLVNPEFKIYVTKDPNDIDRAMVEALDNFVEDHIEVIKANTSRKTIGVLVRLRQMNAVEAFSSSKLYYGEQFTMATTPAITSAETESCDRLIAHLRMGAELAA